MRTQTNDVKSSPVLPYGRQSISEADIADVVAVLRSDWLTTGPKVEEFERAFAREVGARHAVAVSSGTAAVHAGLHGIGIAPSDEVIVPAITFAATANAVLYQGATPVFADVDPDTLLIDPRDVARKITPGTKAVIAVDYAGQPCDYDELGSVCQPKGVRVLADACHALGGSARGRKVGTLADPSMFSFHPVKHITTGEGGMVTTADPDLAARMRRFRNHGITTDHRQRMQLAVWNYDMVELGYNYRLTDFQCALGLRQLGRLSGWIERRQHLARRYDVALKGLSAVTPLKIRAGVSHAYHLYVVRIDASRAGVTRDEVFRRLRAKSIGVNVHYRPVYLHPYYEARFGPRRGLCPAAETAADEILTLPLFPAMADHDVDQVVQSLEEVLKP